MKTKTGRTTTMYWYFNGHCDECDTYHDVELAQQRETVFGVFKPVCWSCGHSPMTLERVANEPTGNPIRWARQRLKSVLRLKP